MGNNWPQTERVGWDLTHTGSSVCVCVCSHSVWACGRVIFFFFFFCAFESPVLVFLHGRLIISTLKLLLMVNFKSSSVHLERPHSSYQCWDVSLFRKFSERRRIHLSVWLCSIRTITCHLKEERRQRRVKKQPNRWAQSEMSDHWLGAFSPAFNLPVRRCVFSFDLSLRIICARRLPWLAAVFAQRCCFCRGRSGSYNCELPTSLRANAGQMVAFDFRTRAQTD